MAKLNFGQAFRNVAPLLFNLAQQKRVDERQTGLDEEAQITRALQNRFLELGISGREQEQALAAQPELTVGEEAGDLLGGLGQSGIPFADTPGGNLAALQNALPAGSRARLGGGALTLTGAQPIQGLTQLEQAQSEADLAATQALTGQRQRANQPAGLTDLETQQAQANLARTVAQTGQATRANVASTTPVITAQQRLLAQSESDVQFENSLGNIFTFLQQLDPEGFFAAKEQREDIRKIDRPSVGELRTLSEDVRFEPSSFLGFDTGGDITPFNQDDSLQFEQLLNILDSLAQQSPSVRLGVGGR